MEELAKFLNNKQEKGSCLSVLSSHYAASAYEIPYEELYKGLQRIIYDVDNTLVPTGAG